MEIAPTKVLAELTPQAFALFVAGSGMVARALSTEKSNWVRQLADFLARGGGPSQKYAMAVAAGASTALSVTSFFSAATALSFDCFFGGLLRPQFQYFYWGTALLVPMLLGWFFTLVLTAAPHQWALTTEPWLPFKINDRFRARPVAQMDLWSTLMFIVLLGSGVLKLLADDPAPNANPVAASAVAPAVVEVQPAPDTIKVPATH